MAMLFLLFAAVTTSLAAAPSVVIKANPLRLTVPFGASLSSTSTVTVITANLVDTSGDVVNFNVTGVPTGASATFGISSTNGNGTFTVSFVVDTTAALAQGTYDLAIVGSGSASYRLPVPLICSYMWSGSAFTNGISTNWATAGNWVGGVVPGPNDNAVLSDSGGTTNITDAPTNLIVAADATVGSLRSQRSRSMPIARQYPTESGTRMAIRMGRRPMRSLSVPKPTPPNAPPTREGDYAGRLVEQRQRAEMYQYFHNVGLVGAGWRDANLLQALGDDH